MVASVGVGLLAAVVAGDTSPSKRRMKWWSVHLDPRVPLFRNDRGGRQSICIVDPEPRRLQMEGEKRLQIWALGIWITGGSRYSRLHS